MNISDIAKIELARYVESIAYLTNYTPMRNALRQSGLVEFLRNYVRPLSTVLGLSSEQATAQAAFCEGYNKALDDVLYFDELYGQAATTANHKIRPTFGALEIALRKGDITQEDIENGRIKRRS